MRAGGGLVLLMIASTAAAEPPAGPLAGIVAAHNGVRAAVGVPPLAWSRDLAEKAANWASHLQGQGCAMRHTRTDAYGQNLAWYSGQSPSAEEVVGDWAAERQHYDRETDSCAEGRQCGHYTQIVWRDTEYLGCARASCGREEVWVCNYAPPGNVIGRAPY